MLVLEIVLAVLVVFGVAAVAMGYGGSITHFSPDWPGRALPEDRAVRDDDVKQVRFSLALRGYRMREVDAALERLATEIAKRDARLEHLTGRPFELSDVDETVSDMPDQQSYPAASNGQTPDLEQTRSFEFPDDRTLADNPYAPPVYRTDDAPR